MFLFANERERGKAGTRFNDDELFSENDRKLKFAKDELIHFFVNSFHAKVENSFKKFTSRMLRI